MHFNLLKLHNCSHFCNHIAYFAALQQYSIEISEHSHIEQLKKAFQSSNKSGDVKKQILNYISHHESFVFRKLNNSALVDESSITNKADVNDHP